ncbi:hypothetical protein KFE25_008428 [Diacronema lutheri]|uniref:Uncharacterized protein n=1 Tax=Diacronema lutheri TaxID=2081491 RepID=A0A8J6C4V1_DIALT|nr:hypothetical protein KFE25_008428 [Diacronema lutheri]
MRGSAMSLTAQNPAGAFVTSIGKRLSVSADTAGRAIKAQTLKAEIMMKEGTIKSVKQEFGVAVYASMEKGDQADTARVFGEFKSRIDALNAEIAAKRLEIQELDKPSQ